VLIRAYHREQGLMLRPDLSADTPLADLLRQPLRWAMRQEGAGAKRFLLETLSKKGLREQDLAVSATTLSERDTAAAICLGQADIAPGARAAASEHGLGFVSTGWESFDLALERGIYFRGLFQALITSLTKPATADLAAMLGGYDLSESGKLVWGQD
ncbi:MAG: substrate-binding domain-containing protein, partial [Thiohalocapsa sp.]